MFFGSNTSWHRFYSLGGGGSVDVVLQSEVWWLAMGAYVGCVCFMTTQALPLSVFIAGNWDERNSGCQLVLAGDFQPLEDWTDGWVVVAGRCVCMCVCVGGESLVIAQAAAGGKTRTSWPCPPQAQRGALRWRLR